MLELNEMIMIYSPSKIDYRNTEGLAYLYTVSVVVQLSKWSCDDLLILTERIYSSESVDINSAPK